MHKRLAVTILLLASSGALAQEDAGLFGGASIGRTFVEHKGSEFSENATAWKLFGGYRFNRNFTAELAYLDAGSGSDQAFGVPVSAEAEGIEISGTAEAPYNDWFSVYARGGALFYDATVFGSSGQRIQRDGCEPVLGVGMAFAIGQATLRGEYERAEVEDVVGHLFTVSLAYRF